MTQKIISAVSISLVFALPAFGCPPVSDKVDEAYKQFVSDSKNQAESFSKKLPLLHYSLNQISAQTPKENHGKAIEDFISTLNNKAGADIVYTGSNESICVHRSYKHDLSAADPKLQVTFMLRTCAQNSEIESTHSGYIYAQNGINGAGTGTKEFSREQLPVMLREVKKLLPQLCR